MVRIKCFGGAVYVAAVGMFVAVAGGHAAGAERPIVWDESCSCIYPKPSPEYGIETKEQHSYPTPRSPQCSPHELMLPTVISECRSDTVNLRSHLTGTLGVD